MITIRNSADLQHALSAPLHPQLRQLLLQRMAQLTGDEDNYDLGELAHFTVVLPGDRLSDVETALGFSVTTNFVDGACFEDPEFTPSWEWLQDHQGWFEMVFVLSNDGFGWVLFVQDDPGVDATLLNLCRTYASEHA
jgi:hypothetical protein